MGPAAERGRERVGWWKGRPVEAAWRTVTVYAAVCPEAGCGWRSAWHVRLLPDLHDEVRHHLRDCHEADR